MKLFFMLILINFANAQSVFVNPKNISPLGTVSTGNTVAGKCDGLNSEHLKVTIQPSCYGANLRGGGSVLDPNKGNVIMDLTLSNSGSSYTSSIQFPNKITWPENYGQTCTWDNKTTGTSSVVCDMTSTGVKINYSCSYVSTSWFLNDYLSCSRIGDPNADGSLNQSIKCSFLFSWAGTSYAAVNSYSKLGGVANCGLQDKTVDLGAMTTVSSSVAATSIDKYAKRGKVSIDYSGLKIKKLIATKSLTTGEFIFSGQHSVVSAIFYQLKDGVKTPLTQKVEAGFDEFEECLDVKVAFLGQNQFCGSFYSPLMLFFDEARPLFVSKSSFPLVDGIKIITWPEKNSPGYFLAIDLNGEMKIVNKKQLFGDGNGFDNGFLALKELDSNHDNVINASDEKFNSLMLWNDKNGNGISEKSEVFRLKDKKVSQISLNYKDDNRKNFGRKAEARQYSEFTFGNNLKGKIIDIWLAPFETKK